MVEFIVELRELRDEKEVGRQGRQALVQENKELKAYVLYLEKQVDSDEQYGWRDCFVLNGEDLPQPAESEPGAPEEPAKTKKLWKMSLKVNLG